MESKPPEKLFTLLDPSKTNVDFSNDLHDSEDFNIVEYLNYYNGAGVAIGDINNDNLPDLYFAANQQSNKLYLNQGDFKFKDITEKAGVSCPGDWKTGVSMADVNGDGWLDIYVCQVGDYKSVQGTNQLFINNGDLTFTEQAHQFGLHFTGFSTQSAFFDYDNDGDLDMFLLNHAIHSRGSYGPAAIVRYTRDLKTGDRLFEQIERESAPYYINVTERAGIFSSRIGYGLGLAIGDVNNDGYSDIYISNDFHENDYLYLNNGNKTFRENIRLSVGHTSKSSMGNDMADFNNDGLIDIFSLDMTPDDPQILKRSAGEEMMQVFKMKSELGYFYQLSRNALQLNRGLNQFSEIGAYSGVYATDWSWAPLFFDADNDGWKDLFISNGIPRRPNDLDYLEFLDKNSERINSTGPGRLSNLSLVAQMPSDTISNHFYKNNGDLTFDNYAEEWGVDHANFSNSSAYGDLDNDGDLDLVVSNLNSPCFIYRNNSNTLTKHNFVRIKLKGSTNNQYGIGAKIEIWKDSSVQVQEVQTSRGSMSSVDPIIIFGIGSATSIDSLSIYWPGGAKEVRKEVDVNQEILLDMANAQQAVETAIPGSKTIFTPIRNDQSYRFRHLSDLGDDVTSNPLIPHNYLSLGPKMTISKNDQRMSMQLYICGGSGQSGRLITLSDDANIRTETSIILMKAVNLEEQDATFFDADGDGDEDLVIATLRDQNRIESSLFLYINDGKGKYQRARKKVPDLAMNISCVLPFDFDADGDLDLFLGGLPDANQYGELGTSEVLLNNGSGNFITLPDAQMGDLQHTGMVSDAIWADLGNHDQMELILIGNWMGLTILSFDGQAFQNTSDQHGVGMTTGWWNTLEAVDIDRDGDMDLIAGNFGLNSKLKATKEEPVVLYSKDFDSDGTIDPIITYFKNGKEMIFATRDELVAQIPSLQKRFSSYRSYAEMASLDEVFSVEQWAEANVSKAVESRSCLFINDGNGLLSKSPLPKEAQLFPIYAILPYDIDRDGLPDLILGGNQFETQLEYGRYDAGHGLVMMNKGQGTFEAKSLPSSGILIRGEIRDAAPVNIGDKQLFLFTRKNDEPALFTLP